MSQQPTAEAIILADELTLQIPGLRRPTLENVRMDRSSIKRIERDSSPTGEVTFRLGTILRDDEDYINPFEYECRIAPKLDFLLGYQHAAWLVEHQNEFPELVALRGSISILFPGIVVVDSNHDYGRLGLSLPQMGGYWKCRWYLLENGYNNAYLFRSDRIAISSE
ncbi:MAG: hypothetical protein KJI72_02340 [Patescibacteria group bacterium]|nr:hypothetical protein [Patescibacteria group bacterium]